MRWTWSSPSGEMQWNQLRSGKFIDMFFNVNIYLRMDTSVGQHVNKLATLDIASTLLSTLGRHQTRSNKVGSMVPTVTELKPLIHCETSEHTCRLRHLSGNCWHTWNLNWSLKLPWVLFSFSHQIADNWVCSKAATESLLDALAVPRIPHILPSICHQLNTQT